MMTRAPVMVTFSQNPYHVASFKDSAREFDLGDKTQLEALRKEVEVRMRKSVQGGRTVSKDVISMNVKGPSLQRMVLVDLPGVICTETAEMAHDTREAIQAISEQHMSNPNAIIVCVQDGSVDAERTNVAQLVSKMDPQGKRTFLALTKVDLAEENLANPDRMKKILSGQLLKMKALGHYAVVTGRGNDQNETIEDIRSYEEEFFRKSKLFSSGGIRSSQCTTQNLARAVQDCFWKMVRESVEQQADAFKADRFNLETEWKNHFPKQRELDRDELFEKARGEVLDMVVSLSQVSSKQWEDAIVTRILGRTLEHIFEEIYLPASQSCKSSEFNTRTDIRLKKWADAALPRLCVDIGREVLQEEFRNLLEAAKQQRDHDDIFDKLTTHVIDEATGHHKWDERAMDDMRFIQRQALQDWSVPDKPQWDEACRFHEEVVKEKEAANERILRKITGPSGLAQWLYWQSPTQEQRECSAIKGQLETLLHTHPDHPIKLSADELTTVRKNVQALGHDVDGSLVEKTWGPVYQRHFLEQALARSRECRRSYHLYEKGHMEPFGINCNDVVLFWRIQQLVKNTASGLRKQIMNLESRRLEKGIKEVLEDMACDREKKTDLLTGRRVLLAEELKRVRQVQEKLEEFIHALNHDDK